VWDDEKSTHGLEQRSNFSDPFDEDVENIGILHQKKKSKMTNSSAEFLSHSSQEEL
jgi:hypothetical protein